MIPVNFIRHKPTAEWWQLANCLGVDTELFFAVGRHNEKERRKICTDCIVQIDCLADALHNDDHGFRGGLSRHTRRTLPIELRHFLRSA